jgi:hypothetical protein
MAKLYGPLSFLLWLLGLLATIAAVIGRLAPRLRSPNLEMRSLLLFAGVLFLGAIATWAMGRKTP